MIRYLIFICFLFGNLLASSQSEILNEADSLYANGNFSKAIILYETYDMPSKVYGKIARANMAIGNYKDALKFYNLEIKAHPDKALSKYEYAKLLNKTKKFKKAIVQFNDLITIDSLNPNYHYDMGLALEKLKDTTAILSFHNAFVLDTNHQKAIFKLAKYDLIKRNHETSHALIDIGLKSYPENLELISLKAQNYYHQQYYKEAKLWFEKLIDLGESSEFIHEKMSVLYAECSQWEKAIEHRKLALKYNPIDATGIFLLGNYYKNLENFEEAERYYLKSIALQDQPLDYEYQQLGIVLNRQEKHQGAIAAFQRAAKENPQNYSAKFYALTTKDAYYADVETKIKLYQNFIEETPKDNFTVHFAKRRLKELKEEKFTTLQKQGVNNED